MMGGALGALLRVVCAQLFTSDYIAIFLINALGCFLIGYVNSALSHERKFTKAFLTKGVFGGFTTFSTFALIDALKITNGEFAFAVFYILASVIICTAFVRLGFYFAQILNIQTRIFR